MNEPDSPLLSYLLSEPEQFTKEGLGYELLQSYFQGLPLDTLRPLIKNQNVLIRRQALWILSELGSRATPLITDLPPLVTDDDRYVQYHLLEALAVCASGTHTKMLRFLIEAMDGRDSVIRVHAMFLLSNLEAERIADAISLFASDEATGRLHRAGLEAITKGLARNHTVALEWINSATALRRKYGAIYARRFQRAEPMLLKTVAQSHDQDLVKFFYMVVEDPC